MRTRSLSSVGVVVVGLLPALVGGPVFALLMAVLCIIAYREYAALAAGVTPPASIPPTGYAAVAALAAAGLFDERATIAVSVAALAVGIPLVAAFLRVDASDAFAGWSLAAAGSLYLGLPAFAAIALRHAEGSVDAPWLRDVADAAAIGWPSLPRGLAWLLVVLLCTWLGDTAAYLVGRTVGRRPLIPRVSPNKTVEGAVGGLVGAALTGALAVRLFGLDLPVGVGLSLGAVIGVVGQLGDLAESLLKRQAGVKDSGNLIPGHGGMLDRIDALLFSFALGWPLAGIVDRVTT